VKAKWDSITSNLPARDGVLLKWWNVLRSNYDEPERSYHNFERILKLLKLFDEYEEHLSNPDAVVYAIFFHK
jgi:predicted metal-dependent HD superfamily phosphohydrolase